jgi:hypothetical protein
MTINHVIQQIQARNDKKLILILGSGFHTQAFNSETNVLSDWSKLLLSVCPHAELTENYILDFETIVRIKTRNQCTRVKYATQIERDLLKDVAEKILSVKIDRTKQFYPLDIFNSNYVSDVISLNFDTVPERLLSGNSKLKCHYAPFTSKEKLKEDERNALLYHQVEGIKFWHPHGTVEKPSSILLGMRRYGQRIKMVERLRKNYKSKSKDGSLEIEGSNWYDLLTTRPIIICGASLSNAEWDIWTALVNRSRNYARYPKREQPIYIMTDEPGLYEKRTKDSVNYFIPLTSKKESFTTQWNKLEKLFSSKK